MRSSKSQKRADESFVPHCIRPFTSSIPARRHVRITFHPTKFNIPQRTISSQVSSDAIHNTQSTPAAPINRLLLHDDQICSSTGQQNPLFGAANLKHKRRSEKRQVPRSITSNHNDMFPDHLTDPGDLTKVPTSRFLVHLPRLLRSPLHHGRGVRHTLLQS
jgi:hypothetical protein